MKHFSAPNFQAIIYPESIADLDNDAIPFLRRTGYQVSISPLHDSDEYDAADVADWMQRHKGDKSATPPVVGQRKKPHWHVLFHKPKGNGGSRTLLDALKPLVMTDGPRKGEPAITYLGHVPDLYMAERYQAHLDDQDKAQYDPAEIIHLNGFDDHLIDSINAAERTRSAVTRVLDVVNELDTCSFYRLTTAVLGMDDPDMFDVLVSRTPFISLYLKSRFAYFNYEGQY